MASSSKAVALHRRAIRAVRDLPRADLTNLTRCEERNPWRTDDMREKLKPRRHPDQGRGSKPNGSNAHLPVLGWEASRPFWNTPPNEVYNADYFKRREYPPFSLHKLQRMIDLGRIDPTKPVDLAALCNTRSFLLDVANRHYGFQLTDDGADGFTAKVNLEIQHVESEVAIAAIERNGGTLTTRFFDPPSLFALRDPEKFFTKGLPIPRCALPPQDAIAYYIDPKKRGYLADPREIAKARLNTAQKYGYRLADLNAENDSDVRDNLLERKDPRQIFYGLWPGWVVNVRDKTIIKPKDQELVEFYAS